MGSYEVEDSVLQLLEKFANKITVGIGHASWTRQFQEEKDHGQSDKKVGVGKD